MISLSFVKAASKYNEMRNGMRCIHVFTLKQFTLLFSESVWQFDISSIGWYQCC